jgi:hypothetical protein
MSNIAEAPREKLKEIIAKNGEALLQDPDRCEGLLKDHCGPHRREISALVGALEERVPMELKSSWQSAMTPEAMRARLVQRLQDNRGLAPDVADWAVDAWSYALGVGLGRRSERLESEVISVPVISPAGMPGVLSQPQAPADAAWAREFGNASLAAAAASQPQPQSQVQPPVPVKTGWSTGTKVGAAVAAAVIIYLVIPKHTAPKPCPAGQIRAVSGNCEVVPPPPPPPPVEPPKVTAAIAVGTPIPVTVSEALDSETVMVGQFVKGAIQAAVELEGKTVVPAGTKVVLQVKGVDQAGKILGAAKIDFALVEMTVHGKKYTVASAETAFKGPSKTANTAKKAGIFGAIGAAAGCGISHVAGHKCATGAEVGAGGGVAAGVAVSAHDKPKPAQLKAGTILKFKLSQPLNLG